MTLVFINNDNAEKFEALAFDVEQVLSITIIGPKEKKSLAMRYQIVYIIINTL